MLKTAEKSVRAATTTTFSGTRSKTLTTHRQDTSAEFLKLGILRLKIQIRTRKIHGMGFTQNETAEENGNLKVGQPEGEGET